MDLLLARGADVHAEIEVRRSRFITWLRRVQDAEGAREFVADARRELPGARHHCSAFIVRVPGANAEMRSSDDGEPAGTAGMPMLEVLRGSGVTDVAAVVTRFFGGIKLGTGGLVRAYSDAVRAALENATLVRPEELGLWACDLPHSDAGRVEAELHARGVRVHDVSYGAQATITVATDDHAAVRSLLGTLISGDPQLREAGQTVVEHPVG